MKLATSMVFAIATSIGSAAAFAANAAPPGTLTPQQQKMSDCSKDAHAKSLKGDDYKSFMSTCMKSTNSAAKPSATAEKATDESGTQAAAMPAADPVVQQKKKACATDAKSKGLKGTDRRAYMGTCMKNAGVTQTTSSTPAK